ncbi:ABC transporter permease [Nocardioides panacisoli]|uniref:ABC transporter permease n=1 Tax=Nocardioides panacisoli TaxID=627624 RepID=UPI001C62702D|nr:ABC transporter permease [Nocardioides panacisoli]QYJ02783.1 ABC transporter permease [Nocardioides panacisoli]
MNTTYLALETRRVARDLAGLFFIVGLPAFLYLIFGAGQEWGDVQLEHGNVAMYVMVGMAAYGAVTATTGVGGSAAVERMQGWGRQLGLTPLSDRHYVALKAVVAVAIAALPVLLIFGLGWVTGAQAEAWVWVVCALAVLLGATTFALYGLAIGLAFRSESAVSVAGGSLVILGFLGNLFFPLTGTMLTIAKFTPLYGYAALARFPIAEGGYTDADGGLGSDPLWLPITNVVVWTLIFAAVATLVVRRSRGRQ